MSIAGMILGIFTILVMFIALIPLLGWLNWLNIPFAAIGLIFSIIGTSQGKRRSIGTAGIILCSFAILIGTLRLILGGGIL